MMWNDNCVIHLGDCLEVLKTIPDESIDCCVTSPPYFGLRDYGVDGQVGLELTPKQYINKLADIFDEVKRVLRKNGTFWLNIGDSYASYRDGKYSPNSIDNNQKDLPTKGASNRSAKTFVGTNIKHKETIGIPWMLAFELRERGWYIRQDIIWHKNSMPESVKDRCTRAHEYIFLLTKESKYYYDNEIIKTPCKEDWGTRNRKNGKYHNVGTGLQPHTGLKKSYEKANKRSVWKVNTKPYKGAHFATYPPELIEPCILAGCPVGGTVLDPFNGSGTTGYVALSNSRKYVGIELNPDYIELSKERLKPFLYKPLDKLFTES